MTLKLLHVHASIAVCVNIHLCLVPSGRAYLEFTSGCHGFTDDARLVPWLDDSHTSLAVERILKHPVGCHQVTFHSTLLGCSAKQPSNVGVIGVIMNVSCAVE